MHLRMACLWTLSALSIVACGRSSSPASPSDLRSATQNPAPTSFGVLVQERTPAPGEGSGLARCLSGTGEASCFSAASLQPQSVAFSHIPRALATQSAGAADTALPDAPTGLASSSTPQDSTSSIFLQWNAPTTGPAPTNFCGLSGGSNEIAVFVR